MSYKGNKLAASFQQHAASDAAKDMEQVLKSLSKGPLRDMHFDTAKRYFASCLATDPIIITQHSRDTKDETPHQKAESRQLELYLAYMAISSVDHGLYSPAIQRTIVSPLDVIILHRLFPLRLHSSHLEFRHVQRSAKALEYGEDPFKFAAAFSLLLSQVLEKQIPKESRENVPIVIPQPQGMFLGSARQVHPQTFMPIASIFASYRQERPVKYEQVATMPHWLPTIEITAKTYIHQRDFSGSQRMLYESLLPFYEDSEKTDILGRFVDSYIIGTTATMTERNRQKLALISEKLTKITESTTWQVEVKKAAANFAKKELN